MELKTLLSNLRPELASLSPYTLKHHAVRIKLDQNENPFAWPQEISQRVADFIRAGQLNRYPPFTAARVEEKIAAYVGCQPENIMAANGSNDALHAFLLSVITPGKKLITVQPTFTVYQLLSNLLGGCVEAVALKDDLSYDFDALVKTVSRNPDSPVILCSPNNPTGCSLSRQQVEQLAGVCRNFILIDQAYIEFGGEDVSGCIDLCPNVIIARTFSKAFGAAGLRMGYLVGHAQCIAQFRKAKLPYAINSCTQFAAEVLLDHAELMRRQIEQIKREAKRMYQQLSEFAFERVFASDANFFVVKLTHHNAYFDYLLQKSILIRDVSNYPLLSQCVRISVGTTEENDALFKATTSFFKECQ